MQKCLKLKTAKGDNKESKQARVMHRVYSVSVHVGYIPARYHPNILNCFGVIENAQNFVKKCEGK